MHCLRVQYQTLIWRQAHVAYPEIPSPIGCGWKSSPDNGLIIDWIDGDMMPAQLADILASTMLDQNDEQIEDATIDQELEEDYEIDNIMDIVFEDDQDD